MSCGVCIIKLTQPSGPSTRRLEHSKPEETMKGIDKNNDWFKFKDFQNSSEQKRIVKRWKADIEDHLESIPPGWSRCPI